jgi:hypothetical protein
MSKNRNRAKLNKAETSKEYNLLLFDDLYPPYWDDGLILYPRYRRGFKNPNKSLERYKMRMYRTWKHNRKTQWK